jgi:hypothetical protein
MMIVAVRVILSWRITSIEEEKGKEREEIEGLGMDLYWKGCELMSSERRKNLSKEYFCLTYPALLHPLSTTLL